MSGELSLEEPVTVGDETRDYASTSLYDVTVPAEEENEAEQETMMPLLHDHSDAGIFNCNGSRNKPLLDATKRVHNSLPVLLARELTKHLNVIDRRVNYMQPDLEASKRFFEKQVAGAASLSSSGQNSVAGSRASSSNGYNSIGRASPAVSTSARTRPYSYEKQSDYSFEQ